MKNLALVTLGSSPGSGVAKQTTETQLKQTGTNKKVISVLINGFFSGTQTFIWYGVASIFGEVVFNFGFSS